MDWISVVTPTWLRIFLLSGLVLHKLTWEVLKRKGGQPAARKAQQRPPLVRMLKIAKIAFLVGFLVQTICLDILPISTEPKPLQITGVAIFLAGLSLAVAARLSLGTNWSDVEDSRVLQHQRVVDSGVYHFIRHPIYTGDVLLILGLELALNSWLVLGVLLLAPVVFRQAIAEEKLLAGAFPDYARYCARTKRFLPFVI